MSLDSDMNAATVDAHGFVLRATELSGNATATVTSPPEADEMTIRKGMQELAAHRYRLSVDAKENSWRVHWQSVAAATYASARRTDLDVPPEEDSQ